ncbi:MAG: class I SAM-dependent methyltransferase [Bacteriovoracia bacterium]
MAQDFSLFDSRNYPTVSVTEGYAKWAQIYERDFDSALDQELFGRITSVPWRELQTAADLACGTGRTGAWLHAHGVATLDGVDLTPEMMERAQTRGIYRSLKLEDIRRTSLPMAAYDLVINSLASEHLETLAPLFSEARRLARPGGYFVILGYHPHFMLRGIPTHFDDPQTQAPIAIRGHVHLLSDFIKAGRETGWKPLELDEKVVDPEWAERNPGMKKHLGHPISFVGVFQSSC